MNGRKRNTGHREAQRKYAAEECPLCGGKRNLQRHHRDMNSMNNEPENISILCQTCHKNAHMKSGTWGRGPVKPRNCVICEKEFQPKRNKRGKLCGNPDCLRELGRRSAALRWA